MVPLGTSREGETRVPSGIALSWVIPAAAQAVPASRLPALTGLSCGTAKNRADLRGLLGGQRRRVINQPSNCGAVLIDEVAVLDQPGHRLVAVENVTTLI